VARRKSFPIDFHLLFSNSAINFKIPSNSKSSASCMRRSQTGTNSNERDFSSPAVELICLKSPISAASQIRLILRERHIQCRCEFRGQSSDYRIGWLTDNRVWSFFYIGQNITLDSKLSFIYSDPKLFPRIRWEKVAPAGQLSKPKLELQMPKPDNPGNNKLFEIFYY